MAQSFLQDRSSSSQAPRHLYQWPKQEHQYLHRLQLLQQWLLQSQWLQQPQMLLLPQTLLEVRWWSQEVALCLSAARKKCTGLTDKHYRGRAKLTVR